MRMSIALFAPGWITEKFPDADPIEHGLRLFCFDVPCSGCKVTIHSEREVQVVINDVVVEGTTDESEISVTIRKPFHLRSLHLITDDFADCHLYQVTVEEIFITENCK
ncbi:hypothetical protein OESDEN_03284 [Oesophagostomum dentatum]|uniref:Galectin n=1 Tax=Oesophagostomum dentatum TaxID=61180 RepID=A0A0B1TLQ2_OESDE|nr:hypothetical protein OESDEN_03284 [Oesophagostomum dentatum]